MENSTVLIYDGSFNGYLTALHVALDNPNEVYFFQKANSPQNGLFEKTKLVTTQVHLAKSVWEDLERKGTGVVRKVYFAFLSETKDIETIVFTYIQTLFNISTSINVQSIHEFEQKISQIGSVVEKEKRYIESHLNFGMECNPIKLAEIAPKNNILPLISRYFRFKYAKEQWIIFDTKRGYGLYFNTKSVEIINKQTCDWYLNINQMIKSNEPINYRYAV